MIEEQRLREDERDRLVKNLDRQIADCDWQMDETFRRMQENYAWKMETDGEDDWGYELAK